LPALEVAQSPGWVTGRSTVVRTVLDSLLQAS